MLRSLGTTKNHRAKPLSLISGQCRIVAIPHCGTKLPSVSCSARTAMQKPIILSAFYKTLCLLKNKLVRISTGNPPIYPAEPIGASFEAAKRKDRLAAAFSLSGSQPRIKFRPGSCVVVRNATDAATCAAPWPRSGGCARGSRRTACPPLPGCGRCSCRCRSACAAPWPRAA